MFYVEETRLNLLHLQTYLEDDYSMIDDIYRHRHLEDDYSMIDDICYRHRQNKTDLKASDFGSKCELAQIPTIDN